MKLKVRIAGLQPKAVSALIVEYGNVSENAAADDQSSCDLLVSTGAGSAKATVYHTADQESHSDHGEEQIVCPPDHIVELQFGIDPSRWGCCWSTSATAPSGITRPCHLKSPIQNDGFITRRENDFLTYKLIACG